MNPYIIPPIISAVLFLVMGLFVLKNNHRSTTNITFAIVCVMTFWWQFTWTILFSTRNPDLAQLLAKVGHCGIIFIPICIFHFFVSFLRRVQEDRFQIALFYTLGVLLLVLLWATPWFINGCYDFFWGFYPKAGILHPIYAILCGVITLRVIDMFLKEAKRPNLPQKRYQQIKYSFVGIMFYALVTSDFLINYGFEYYPMGFLPSLIAFGIWTYAIVKHQLMDIEVVIKRTLFYSLIVFLISLGYISIIFIAHKIFVGELPVSRIFLKSIPIYSIPNFVVSVYFLILGVFVLLKNRTASINRMFFLLALATFGWLFFYGLMYATRSYETAYLLSRIGHSSAVCVTPCIYQLFVLLLGSYVKPFDLRLVKIAIGGAILAIFMVVTNCPPNWYLAAKLKVVSYGYYPVAGPLMMVFATFTFFLAVRAIYLLVKASRQAKQELQLFEYQRFKYLALALGLFVIASLDYLPKMDQFSFYPFGFVFVGLFASISTYAIVRHRLMDIEIVLKKTLFYSLLTVLISLSYLLLVFLFHSFFVKGGSHSFLVSFLGVLFIAITFKPLEIALHHLMERKFFKGTIAEIAEQKQKLETELERRERLKSVGILAAGMAHEIKNPLSAIKTFNEYLLEKHADPEFVKKFQRIVGEEVNKIDHIVRQLLEFARPKPPVLKPVDIRELLNDTLDLLNSDCLKHRVTVRRQWTDGPLMIQADKEQLRQVFLNLILNSLEAMPEGGELTVNCELTTDGRITVTITDTGSGIPTDKLPHIFDPFFTTKEEGTGLGLAIVHGIIQQHKGTIKVESEAGKGTVVRMRFPAIT